MPRTSSQTGFQPRNTPAERRAFYDLDRRTRQAILATTYLAARWHYETPLVAPPGPGAIRSDDPITRIWLSKTDDGGYTRIDGFSEGGVGDRLKIRGNDGTILELRTTGAKIDHGTYIEVPVALVSGTATGKKGTLVEIDARHA